MLRSRRQWKTRCQRLSTMPSNESSCFAGGRRRDWATPWPSQNGKCLCQVLGRDYRNFGVQQAARANLGMNKQILVRETIQLMRGAVFQSRQRVGSRILQESNTTRVARVWILCIQEVWISTSQCAYQLLQRTTGRYVMLYVLVLLQCQLVSGIMHTTSPTKYFIK